MAKFVTKAATPKQKNNVALILTQADVPAFLAKTVIVSEGKIYIGTSAGSILAGPDIYPTYKLVHQIN